MKILPILKTIILLLVFGVIINLKASAQYGVSINTTGNSAVNSAILDVSSTTKGFLPPRMTEVQRDQIPFVAGLMIYNTTTNKPNYYNGTEWLFPGTGEGGVCQMIDAGDNAYPIAFAFPKRLALVLAAGGVCTFIKSKSQIT